MAEEKELRKEAINITSRSVNESPKDKEFWDVLINVYNWLKDGTPPDFTESTSKSDDDQDVIQDQTEEYKRSYVKEHFAELKPYLFELKNVKNLGSGIIERSDDSNEELVWRIKYSNNEIEMSSELFTKLMNALMEDKINLDDHHVYDAINLLMDQTVGYEPGTSNYTITVGPHIKPTKNE